MKDTLAAVARILVLAVLAYVMFVYVVQLSPNAAITASLMLAASLSWLWRAAKRFRKHGKG